jgi:hypothetical protein
MKKIILTLALALVGLIGISQGTVLKKISAYKKYTSGEKSTFTFYVNDPSTISMAKIVINGTDYNYDNDADYTDFRIAVNGNNLIDVQTLNSQGMPGNGTYGDINFDIKNYLHVGENTILLENTEDQGQVDYAYINTISVLVDYGKSSTTTSYSTGSQTGTEITKTDIWKKFASGFSQTYTFYISNPNDYTNLKLLINGTDYDYDKDGDWTDFRVTLNGHSLIDVASLTTVGLGKDGPYDNATWDIGSYLTSGTNTLILENTEDQGQVDYCWINRFIIKGDKGSSSSNYNPSSNVSTSGLVEITKTDIWKNFKCGFSQTYTFNIANINDYNNCQLWINGTDYDYDKDGDGTDFRVTLNGTDLCNVESLSKYGLGKDGPYNNAIWDIQSYLVSGNNTLVLTNTEDEGQVDYDWINRYIIKGIKGSGSSSSSTTNNTNSATGDEIAKTDIWKNFKCGFSQTYTFNVSNASDYQNMKLLINGTDYDYDKDGDWTDFRVTLNGTKLCDVRPLTEYGFGKDGPYNNAIFDVQSNIVSGNNTLTIENTEDQGQVDYCWVNRYILKGEKASGYQSNNNVSTNKYLSPLTVNLNQKASINESFTCQKQKTLTLNVPDINSLSSAELVLNGTDYDVDKDGDYTEFNISINGSALISSKELKAEGIPANGNYGDLVYNIRNLLRTGTNTIVLENSELEGQIDYGFIATVLIRSSISNNNQQGNQNDVDKPAKR